MDIIIELYELQHEALVGGDGAVPLDGGDGLLQPHVLLEDEVGQHQGGRPADALQVRNVRSFLS